MAVNLTFTGDSTSAEAALARLERKYADLENRMKNTKPKSPSNELDQWEASLGRIASKYIGVGAAIGGMATFAAKTGEEIKRVNDLLDKFSSTQPELQVKLQIQGGMKPEDIEKMLPNAEKILLETPVTDLKGFMKTQTQIASSGFDQKDVDSGAATQAMLRFQAGSNQYGEDSSDTKEVVRTSSMLLKGLGHESPTAANLEELHAKLTSLYKDSDVTGMSFRQLAPKVAGMRAFGMTPDEILGSYSAAAEVLGDNKADTGLSNFVTRTATAGAHPERAQDLATIGLSPKDIAISPGGQTFFGAIDVMSKRLKDVDPVTRNNFVSKFFGEEAAPTANYMMSESGNARARKLVESSANNQPYLEANTIFSKSTFADQQRNKVSSDFAAKAMYDKRGGYSWEENRRDMDTSYNKNYADADPLERLELAGKRVMMDAMTTLPWALGMQPAEIGLNRQSFKGVRERPVLSEPDVRGPFDAVRPPDVIDVNDPRLFPKSEEPRPQRAAVNGADSQATDVLTKKLDANTEAVKSNTDAIKSMTNSTGERRTINRNGNRE